MKQPFILFAGILMLSAFILYNCSKDGDNDTVKSYSGEWNGITSDNEAIYFRVNENEEIDSVLVYVVVDLGTGTCSGLYLYKTTITDQTAINDDGTFEVEVNGIQMGFSESHILISGKFNSSTRCSGDFDGADVSVILCGGYLTMGTGMGIDPFTWSAAKD